MTQKCLTNNDEQQARQALREWYQSGLGQSVLTQIQTHINEVVHKIYGYQGLQIGQISPQVDLLKIQAYCANSASILITHNKVLKFKETHALCLLPVTTLVSCLWHTL